MILSTYCDHCEKRVDLKSRATTRPDLAEEKGETFTLTCTHCLKKSEKHVNRVNARSSYKMYALVAGISALATAILLYYFGAVSLLTFAIFFLFVQQANKSTHAFNSYTVRRNSRK